MNSKKLNIKLSSNIENVPLNSQETNRNKSTEQISSKIQMIKDHKSKKVKSDKENVNTKNKLQDDTNPTSTSDTKRQYETTKTFENKVGGEFTEKECGETFKCQRILVDFSKNENDNFVSGQKCNDFWEFVNKNPDLGILSTEPDLRPLDVLINELNDELKKII